MEKLIMWNQDERYNQLKDKCLAVARKLQQGRFGYECALESVLERYNNNGVMVWYHPIDDYFKYIKFEWDEYNENGSRMIAFDQFPELSEEMIDRLDAMLDNVDKEVSADIRKYTMGRDMFLWLYGYVSIERPDWMTTIDNGIIVKTPNVSMTILTSGEFVDAVGTEENVMRVISIITNLRGGK